MSQASNINAVTLGSVPGEVTILGEVTPDDGDKVKLVHVWLSQPGCGGQIGAGLAIDYLAGHPEFVDGGKFSLTAVEPGPGGNTVFGKFFAGPATASVIAVLEDASGAVKEVLQWSRIVVLTDGTVEAATPAAEA